MDRGSWQAIVHRVTKSWTRLKGHAHTHHYGRLVKAGIGVLRKQNGNTEALKMVSAGSSNHPKGCGAQQKLGICMDVRVGL